MSGDTPPFPGPSPLLEDRVAVVTGAGGGVGKGIATALAAHGAAVVIAARRPDNGEPAAARIRERGGRAEFVRCDVTSRADLEAAVDAAVERYGRLDCVVHNAVSPSGPGLRPVQDIEPEHWHDLMATTVRASFDCAQVAHRHLAAGGGSYLLLTSGAGIEGTGNLPVYGTVKAAQRGLVKSLAREWGPDGIRVNAIAPVALTPAMDRAYRENPELEARLVARTPLRRIGDPETDIGPVAVFLASPLARFVTGQTIVVDGGGFLGL